MKYIKYVLRNVEPIRIADDSTSQSGQTSTLTYIPGTTMRGYVINKLAEKESFENVKDILFSQKVQFHNAYLSADGKKLIPSPKGFYEDKTDEGDRKNIENVVINGNFTDGLKRASLGRYCTFEGDTIRYYTVDMDSDLKIKINQGDSSEVFRNEYMAAGNTFVGFISYEDPAVGKLIRYTLSGTVILGNARSQGLGKCVVDSISEENGCCYSEYSVSGPVSSPCYLYLASAMTMRDENGNYCGIDTASLESILGVTDLVIENCATSAVNVKGYNRRWGVKSPSITMYEQGSVFKLKYSGIISEENSGKLMDEGIGVRRNEGFGTVILLADYDKLAFKKAGEKAGAKPVNVTKEPEDDATLRIIAKNYYRIQIDDAMQKTVLNPLSRGKLKNSQIGKIQSLLLAHRYEDENAVAVINKYFDHRTEKEAKQNIQKERGSIDSIKKYVLDVLEKPLETTLGMEDKKTVMGIPTEKLLTESEKLNLKVDYLIEKIQYDNRREDK